MAATYRQPNENQRLRMHEVIDMLRRITIRYESDRGFAVPAGRYVDDVQFLLDVIHKYRKQNSSRTTRLPVKGPERDQIVSRVLELRAKDWTYRAISREVGIHQETVARHCRAAEKARKS